MIECLQNQTTLEVVEAKKEMNEVVGDEVEEEEGKGETDAARKKRGEEKEEKTETEAMQ